MSLRVLVSRLLLIVRVFVALVVAWKELKSSGTPGRKGPPPS